MTERRWAPALILVLTALAVTGLYRSRPLPQAERFVADHGAELEAALERGGGIPARIGYQVCNLWRDGEMAEFILSAWGDTYCGCYYSRRDVPFPFQGADVPLTQAEDGRWTWSAEGDDHGVTWKLRDNWYYFEAGF